MNINETYLKFLNKVNKNFINDNISVDKGRFVIIFNEAQNKYVDWVVSQNNSSIIRNIRFLKINNKELKKRDYSDDLTSFSLPKNFFKFINVRVEAKKGSCTDYLETSFEVKAENVHELYNDKNNEPSFDYRETFYTFSDDGIDVYKKDFEISNVLLTYYRYPTPVDIAGYYKIDNSVSQDINSEFNDDIVDKILDICVKDFNVNSDNLERYQVDNNEVISNF